MHKTKDQEPCPQSGVGQDKHERLGEGDAAGVGVQDGAADQRLSHSEAEAEGHGVQPADQASAHAHFQAQQGAVALRQERGQVQRRHSFQFQPIGERGAGGDELGPAEDAVHEETAAIRQTVRRGRKGRGEHVLQGPEVAATVVPVAQESEAVDVQDDSAGGEHAGRRLKREELTILLLTI